VADRIRETRPPEPQTRPPEVPRSTVHDQLREAPGQDWLDEDQQSLVLNGNWLLLTRVGDKLVEHRRETWWKNYEGADDRLSG
jgi:hypothetical protein